MLVDGAPVSASLFDFGLFFFHNAAAQVRTRHRPVFLSARRWRATSKRGCGTMSSLSAQQTARAFRTGTIRATVLIETILAAFEMDEILYELRDHSAGLNCGRWDYIFSFIKKFRHRPDFVLPDRAQVTMERHFLKSYVRSADPDLPSARHSRHGRDGGADSDQERSRGERARAGQSAAGQAAGSPGGTRRHLGGASRAGADRQGHIRRAHAVAEPDRRHARRCQRDSRRICWRSPKARSRRRASK